MNSLKTNSESSSMNSHTTDILPVDLYDYITEGSKERNTVLVPATECVVNSILEQYTKKLRCLRRNTTKKKP
jgi:hypothetical protein